MTELDTGPRISASMDAMGTEDDLRSLLRWLREDETVGARARLDNAAPPPPGAMGTGFDVLQFAVSGGLSAASLVVSVLQWQTSRSRAPAVTLRRGDVEVVLTAQATRDADTVRALIELLDGGSTPATTLPAPRTEEPGGDDGTA